MKAKFYAFEPRAINKEFLALSTDDFFGLTLAMKSYQEKTLAPAHALVRSLSESDGLFELRHKSSSFTGRLIFCQDKGKECPIVLTVFKKEAPQSPNPLSSEPRVGVKKSGVRPLAQNIEEK